MDLYSALSQGCPGLELRAEEPMCHHTTFRIGGPAQVMALPKSRSEAAMAVRAAARLGIDPIFMGNGSDLLVADAGVRGFLIKAVDGLGELSVKEDHITAGSGVLLSRLANFAQEQGLTGLEFAHGIPGSWGRRHHGRRGL